MESKTLKAIDKIIEAYSEIGAHPGIATVIILPKDEYALAKQDLSDYITGIEHLMVQMKLASTDDLLIYRRGFKFVIKEQ